jgi:tetratricopeptide (TPR) repeat protein
VGRARTARRKSRDEAPAGARAVPIGAAPLPGVRSTRIAAAIVCVVALAAYALTLAPTVTLVDSGELIVAAHGLGVAHPPGFPLYVLAGHVASRVPAGTVAQRLNAFSALCAALAAAGMVLVARRALVLLATESVDATAQPVGATGQPVGATPGPDAASGRARISILPVVLAGLLLAGSRSAWAYATVAEVYALSTLGVVGLLGLALWARTAGTWRALVLLAIAGGLAAGTHHVTIAIVTPGVLALAWPALRRHAHPRRLALLAGAGLLAAAVAYAFLPWAAARGPFPNWGDPRTLERVWWHVSGRQYQAYLTPSAQSMGLEAAAFGRSLLRQFGPAWLPAALALAAIGLHAAWRRSPALARGLGLIVACDLAYALLYTIAEDKDAYYLPAVVAVSLAAALGAHALLARRPRVAIALVAVAVLGLGLNARPSDRSRFFVAHDFVRDTLATVDPDGLLLTSEWQLYSPLLYFQEVEGWRKDVMAVDVSLLRRSWYVDGLRARYAERWAPLRVETDAFLEDLRAWEDDPARYERDPALTRRINDRFQAMVLALCSTDAARGRAFATSDVVLPQSPDPALAERIARAFPLTPRGLVFALASVDPGPPPALAPRGLFDGTLALEPDDVAALKVRPVYVSMMANRGQILRARGDRAAAEAAYRQALSWDPTFAPARASLAQLEQERAAGAR